MQSVRRITLVSPFFIFRAKHQTPRLRPGNGTGTHHTRFYGDIKGTLVQILAAKSRGSGSNGLHFSMGSDISQSFRQVMGAGNNAVLTNNHRPYGYFTAVSRLLSLKKRLLHIIIIVHSDFRLCNS